VGVGPREVADRLGGRGGVERPLAQRLERFRERLAGRDIGRDRVEPRAQQVERAHEVAAVAGRARLAQNLVRARRSQPLAVLERVHRDRAVAERDRGPLAARRKGQPGRPGLVEVHVPGRQPIGERKTSRPDVSSRRTSTAVVRPAASSATSTGSPTTSVNQSSRPVGVERADPAAAGEDGALRPGRGDREERRLLPVFEDDRAGGVQEQERRRSRRPPRCGARPGPRQGG
jgi:hypothetical protein